MNATRHLSRRYSSNNRFVAVRCVTLVPTKARISTSNAPQYSPAMQRIRRSSLSVVMTPSDAWLDHSSLKIVLSLNCYCHQSCAESIFLVRGTTPNGGVVEWVLRAEHVMDSTIPNGIQPGAFVWFEKTQGPLMKVLPVPGWQSMKQLSVRVHFLRCSGLLDDWSVEGVLSLVFV
ncbi:uncharacterized protein TNCV_2245821 [Trichonephila clavipes]|uniref:Uncharacterized protein n=1 Tax=Trichonephila clavipes TaxID=2585209 RepID=A0A8X6RC28_TRICX|nr:uncharacterized protein TNCV_2245821 [Trichonephila clavipes]